MTERASADDLPQAAAWADQTAAQSGFPAGAQPDRRSEPLIALSGIGRSFAAGAEAVSVLEGVDLEIWPGELVAIIGQSGSGKSTLMNILGCLDRPSRGSYHFAGRDVGALAPDQQAELRRQHFGFIFQRYQLLGDLDAVGNVEVPAIYAGAAAGPRRARARALLERLGLGARLDHRPSELSGGQQQRVSVARALMNGGEVILADEPTGALDTRSSAELITLLQELNAAGHTIILVTHDPKVAAHADRVIEISDGRILSDSGSRRGAAAPGGPRAPLETHPSDPLERGAPEADPLQPRPADGTAESPGPLAVPGAAGGVARGRRGALGGFGRLRETFAMALVAMRAHRLRSFLTMLGIIIGIASVVLVVALGAGSQQKVLENISSLGTNTITVRAGTGFGMRGAGRIQTLVPADATAIAAEDYALRVSPAVSANATGRIGAIEASTQIQGVSGAYFGARAYVTSRGALFDEADVAALSQVAVLDEAAAETFFPQGGDPVGQVLMLGRVPVTVIGVVKSAGASFGPSGLSIFLPYSTVMARISGQKHLSSIDVQVADHVDMTEAQARLDALMLSRHGTRDFFLQNSDTIRETITSTAMTLTLLIGAIAVISLVVGGIGVMNIMLVSVTERTREIGVRVAIGARRLDIVAQFLIEAVLVCLIGGVLGITLALAGGWLAEALVSGLRLQFSGVSILAAVLSSTVIGITFGYLPARAAARLDPVVALNRD